MAKSNKSKAQIELWMLTKIAMLFFIIALAAIALNISNTEKSALCGEQTLSTARAIAANINQIIATPAEDARLVYRFEPSLSISKEQFGERYEVNLTERDLPGAGETSGRVQLSVVVSPSSNRECERTATVFYDKRKTSTKYILSGGEITPAISRGTRFVTLKPSNPDFQERTRYLVIVKCTEKTFQGNEHIYLDDCKNDNSNSCSPLEEEATGQAAPHLVECREA